jgi:hypothetical protein
MSVKPLLTYALKNKANSLQVKGGVIKEKWKTISSLGGRSLLEPGHGFG